MDDKEKIALTAPVIECDSKEEPSCPNFSFSMLPTFNEGEMKKMPLTPPVNTQDEDKFDPILRLDPSEIIKLVDSETGKPHILGKGTFGTVFKCQFQRTDEEESEIVAVKEISFENLVKETIEKEVKIVKYLDHPLIIKVHGYFIDEENKKISIVQEFMDGGSLDGYLEKCKKNNGLCNFEKWHLIKTLVKSINFLHAKNVVHRDIKPQNYLMSKDRKRLVMTDFGMVEIKRSGQVERSAGMAGTARYIAPEGIGKFPVYTKKSDIFSLGMTIYHVVTGNIPFHKVIDNLEVVFSIGNKELPVIPESTAEEFSKLIKMCLRYLPQERPTTHDILEYMKKLEDRFIEKYWEVPNFGSSEEEEEEENEEEFVLKSFICHLSKKVFEDPVLLVQSGRTYERKNVEDWIKENNTDPVSGEKLTVSGKALVPNLCVLQALKELVLKKM